MLVFIVLEEKQLTKDWLKTTPYSLTPQAPFPPATFGDLPRHKSVEHRDGRRGVEFEALGLKTLHGGCGVDLPCTRVGSGAHDLDIWSLLAHEGAVTFNESRGG